MSLDDLLDELGDSARPRVRSSVVPRHPGVVRWETSLDRIGEERDAVGRLVDVILNVLDEPPRSVSAVVSRRSARVQEVGDQAVL